MFPDLKQTEVKEVANYLQAGVHTVTVNEVKSSNSIEGYTGTPYVEFKVSNEVGIQQLRFQGVDANTSAAAAKVRTEIFKAFLQNAGAKSFDVFPTACKEILGNKVNVCLATREYWTNDKETGEPTIRQSVDYKFSNTQDKTITWKDSYNKVLNTADQAAYKAAHEAHVTALSGGTTTTESPF
tara:strand:- start:938 stop:1486 length:549 start_codon:yes stop_codon:yes gene_type:complete